MKVKIVKLKPEREMFIVWNNKEDRPAVCRENFGQLLVYLTIEQAQAYAADHPIFEHQRKDYSIKKMKVVVYE